MIQGELSWVSAGNRKQIIVNRTNHAVERLRGLLFTPQPEPGNGLLLTPCNSIHMFGMTYALDVIFLDDSYTVVKCVESIKPWRLSGCRKATMTLECAPGTIEDYEITLGTMMAWSTQDAS